MATFAAEISGRELFVGQRLGFKDPEAPDDLKTVQVGDELMLNREGRPDLEGRFLQTSSRGAVIQITDLSRWLVSPASHSEKRLARTVDKTANVWAVRERLP